MIVPLTREHVPAVARLHGACLTGLLSRLGPAATRAFYAGCVRTPLATGFVCMEDDALRGYVLGSAHPDRLRGEVLRANPIGVIAGLCLGIARRPSTLGWLLGNPKGQDGTSYDPLQAELTYLAVSPAARGSGVGRRLVDAFSGAMKEGGMGSYELSVDDENRSAIAFYEKLGFQLIGHYREFGILHRRYRLSLDS